VKIIKLPQNKTPKIDGTRKAKLSGGNIE